MSYQLPGMPKINPARTQEEVDMRFDLWQSLSDEEFEKLGSPSINDYMGWSDGEFIRWIVDGVIPND